jgi:hypothetical protein
MVQVNVSLEMDVQSPRNHARAGSLISCVPAAQTDQQCARLSPWKMAEGCINYTRTIYTRGAYGTPQGENLYGAHPIYFDHRGNATHGVFLLNSNGMDIYIDRYQSEARGKRSIRWRPEQRRKNTRRGHYELVNVLMTDSITVCEICTVTECESRDHQ